MPVLGVPGMKGLVTQDSEGMLGGKHVPGCGGASGPQDVSVFVSGRRARRPQELLSALVRCLRLPVRADIPREPLLLKRLRGDCENAPPPPPA